MYLYHIILLNKNHTPNIPAEWGRRGCQDTMDRVLRPERLDTDPSSPTATLEWKYWFQTFENFIRVLPQDNLNKLSVLTNHVCTRIYQTISDCDSYADAIEVLKSQNVKPPNQVFARHHLATRRQQSGETERVFLGAENTEQRL